MFSYPITTGGKARLETAAGFTKEASYHPSCVEAIPLMESFLHLSTGSAWAHKRDTIDAISLRDGHRTDNGASHDVIAVGSV